jgi:hypothetical protein
MTAGSIREEEDDDREGRKEGGVRRKERGETLY